MSSTTVTRVYHHGSYLGFPYHHHSLYHPLSLVAPKVEVKTENTEITKSSNVVPKVETNTVVEKDEPIVTVETNTTEDADSTTTTTVTTEVRPVRTITTETTTTTTTESVTTKKIPVVIPVLTPHYLI